MCEEEKSASCYVYMLRCNDGSIYTGWTTDLDARLKAHNTGKGAKYTRARLPVRLAYYERHSEKRQAMHREWEIKQFTRAQKICLIKKFKLDV